MRFLSRERVEREKSSKYGWSGMQTEIAGAGDVARARQLHYDLIPVYDGLFGTRAR